MLRGLIYTRWASVQNGYIKKLEKSMGHLYAMKGVDVGSITSIRSRSRNNNAATWLGAFYYAAAQATRDFNDQDLLKSLDAFLWFL